MRKKSNLIVGLSLLTVALLLVAAILLFPVTAWKAWASINLAVGNDELAEKADRMAFKAAAERDFREYHGEKGVWVEVPATHFVIASLVYWRHMPEEEIPYIFLPSGGYGFYVLRHTKLLFTVENLDAFEQSLNRN